MQQILADLAIAPALVVDGGQLEVVSSTLVNTNLPEPAVEREGAIPAEQIAAVLSRAG